MYFKLIYFLLLYHFFIPRAGRFQFYYIFKGASDYDNDLPTSLFQDETLETNHNEVDEEANQNSEDFELNIENNPKIASALVSETESEWKQCHEHLRNLIHRENQIDKVQDKFWTLENVLMSSKGNDVKNSIFALELCHSFLFNHMRKDRIEMENEHMQFVIKQAREEMVRQGFFPDMESADKDHDFKRSVTSILAQDFSTAVPEIQEFESMMNDINDVRKEALKKIHSKLVDIVDSSDSDKTDDRKQEEILQLLVACGDTEESEFHARITVPVKRFSALNCMRLQEDDQEKRSKHRVSVLMYILWILNDYIIQSTYEMKRWACCIIDKCFSFVLLRKALKNMNIGACKSALLYLNMTPKDGFPPLDPLIDFVEMHCSKTEDLPEHIQTLLPQMREDIKSTEPSILKPTISFFKNNITSRWLVETGLVSRFIELIGGNRVASTAVKTYKEERYPYREFKILNNEMALDVLDLLYNIVVDGEYGAVAVEAADKDLTTIQSYLTDHVQKRVCRKCKCTKSTMILSF